MATHSSVLAWRTPGTGEPGGLLSMGLHRVRHDWSDLTVAAAVSLEWRIYAFFSSLWCSPLHFCSVKIFISLYQYVFNICYNSVHHCIHPPWAHRLLRVGLLYQELLSASPPRAEPVSWLAHHTYLLNEYISACVTDQQRRFSKEASAWIGWGQDLKLSADRVITGHPVRLPPSPPCFTCKSWGGWDIMQGHMTG